MKKRRSDAHQRKSERLEQRQMLAADLGVELSSLADLDSEIAEVASSGVDGTNTAAGVADGGAGSVERIDASDVVLEWNRLFNELLVADETNQNPGYASRSMAMLNLAIYDAVTIANGNADDTFYDYGFLSMPGQRVSAEAVASQAAYTVLSTLYPDEQTMIDAFRDVVLAGGRGGAEAGASALLGTEIGNAILAARADDGSNAIVDYTYSDGAGSFQADPLNPDVPVWGPGWGEVDPFVISSAESFAPETTPALTSEEYAASYNEVKELGSVDSTTRTADQTEAGIFWAYDREGLGTPLSLFNDVLETIAVQQGNTLEENAALFAQASVAMADAAIVAWHTKFDEEFWRPVTAIHDGDLDGNPLTEGDADWTALGAPDGGDDIIGFTPQFPTYISGHATFGGALFGAIQEFYGTDDIAFELASKELEILIDNPELQAAYGLDLDDAMRSFDSLSEAMAENGRSRVYLGIHFDFDDLVGQEVGQAVAATVSPEFIVAENNGAKQVIRHARGTEGPGRRLGTGQEDTGPDRGPDRFREDFGLPTNPVGRGRAVLGPFNGPARAETQRPPVRPLGPELGAIDNAEPARQARKAGGNAQPGPMADRPADEADGDRLRRSAAATHGDPSPANAVDEAFSEFGQDVPRLSLDNQAAVRRRQR